MEHHSRITSKSAVQGTEANICFTRPGQQVVMADRMHICLGRQLTRVVKHISSKDHIRLKIMRRLPLHLQDLYSLQCMHEFEAALARGCWLECNILAWQRGQHDAQLTLKARIDNAVANSALGVTILKQFERGKQLLGCADLANTAVCRYMQPCCSVWFWLATVKLAYLPLSALGCIFLLRAMQGVVDVQVVFAVLHCFCVAISQLDRCSSSMTQCYANHSSSTAHL